MKRSPFGEFGNESNYNGDIFETEWKDYKQQRETINNGIKIQKYVQKGNFFGPKNAILDPQQNDKKVKNYFFAQTIFFVAIFCQI